MQCPKCGADVGAKMKFCPECGTSVISSASKQSGQEADASLDAQQTLTTPLAASPDVVSLSASVSSARTQFGPLPEKPADTAAAGTPLDERYELLEEIGRGGFAVVHRARDKKLDRFVAVKRLQPEKLEGASGKQTLERFRREAQAIAKLNHRNIVAVFDHDHDANGEYIVMEYVGGGTLRSYLKERGGKLPVPEAVELIRGVAQGLNYAHRKNLVHRDIKPANILLAREADEIIPKIVDFGLARLGTDSELSQSGYGLGTPYYMPPEQRRDAKSVNHTADIYALGKTLYELVTGQVPDNVDPENIPPPAALAQLIFRCVKANPEDRFFSAEELLAALDKIGVVGVTGKEHAAAENPCPACGSDNPADAQFCEKCGAGLTRDCPECGRKNPTIKQYCGGCGTEIEVFGKMQEALGRMERYLTEKKYTRVLKEVELCADLKFKERGPKSRALDQQLKESKSKAEQAEAEKTRLSTEIKRGTEGRRYSQLAGLLDAYARVSGERPAEHEALQQHLPVLMAIQQEEVRLARAEDLRRDLKWGEALALLVPTAPAVDAAVPEDQSRLAELQQQREKLLIELEEKIVAAWSEYVWRHTQTSWNMAQIQAAVNSLDQSSLPAESVRLHKIGLLQKLYQAAADQEEWTAAQALAGAWEQLAPKDAAATRAAQQAAAYLDTYAGVGKLLKLYRARGYTACAKLCQQLIDKRGGDFNIEAPEFSGTCSGLKDRALAQQAELDQQLQVIAEELQAKRWSPAKAKAETILKMDPINTQAQALLQQALAGLRQRKIWIGVAATMASVLVVAGVVWGWSAWETRSREQAFVGHVVAGEFEAALRLAPSLAERFPPAAQFATAWSQVTAARTAAEGQKAATLAPVEWAQAQQQMQKALTAFQREDYSAASQAWKKAEELFQGSENRARQAQFNTELTAARAARDAQKWDEVLRYAKTALAMDGSNAEAQRLRDEAEQHRTPGESMAVDLGGGVKMDFAWIPSGEFLMGSPASEAERGDDETQHRVTISKGFWMGKTEVTQAQWARVMGNNPSNFKGANLPVESVSWNDCQKFIKQLNGKAEMGNWKASLPTEAQWEYACRAGTTTRFSKGDAAADLARAGWYSESKTHEVGQKEANAWGLYDMHGNVWEWCQDWSGPYSGAAVSDPIGPDSGSYRVLRGGSWGISSEFCRSAYRGRRAPGIQDDIFGLRVVLIPR